MKMRKLFAGIAAAATMLGGLAIGATAASAANGQPTADTFPLKFQAAEQSRLENRDLTAYKLADYVEYTTGTDPQTKQYAIQTVGIDDAFTGFAGNFVPAIRTALKTALSGSELADKVPSDSDPMAWASQQGVWDQSTKKPYAEGTMGGKGVENDNVVPGSSRKFADALKTAAGNGNLGEGVKLTLGQPTCTEKSDQSLSENDMNCTAEAKGPASSKGGESTDLPLGVYLILDKAAPTQTGTPASDKTTSQAIAMIVSPGEVTKDHRIVKPEAGWTVTIDMKNEVTPVAKAVADKDTVPGVGDTRVWTITSNVPNWVGKDLNSAMFTFTDTPGKGQTISDLTKLTVTIDKTALTFGTDYKIYTNEGGEAAQNTEITAESQDKSLTANGQRYFIVDLTGYMKTAAVAGENSKIDQSITMTYSSTVNADAVASDVSKITNRVEVNNNGGTAEASANLPKPVSFMFTKVNADDEKLAGARFSLTRSAGVTKSGNYMGEDDAKDDTDTKYMKVTGENGSYTINPNDKSAKLADGEEDNPLVSSSKEEAKGTVKVDGVGAGTYTVKETAAPAGYWNTALPTMTITVAKDGKVTFSTATGDDIFGLVTPSKTEGNVDDNDDTATVKNIRNITQLPLTGAAGIAMFTVIGLLVLGAGVLVYAKSRSTRKAMMA